MLGTASRRIPFLIAVSLVFIPGELVQPSVLRPATLDTEDAPASPAGYNVSVTYTGGGGPDAFADTSGFIAFFNVKNTGTLANTYTLTCYGTYIECTSYSPEVITLQPGDAINVTAYYRTTSGIGAASIRLSAEGTQALKVAFFNFTTWPKVQHAVIVTPVSATAPSRTSFTSGYTAAFTVKNVGMARDSFNLFCQPAGNVSCTSQTLATTPGLNTFDSSTVTVTYATAASGPGFIALQASSEFAPATGSWSFNVTIGPSTAVTVTPDSQGVGVLANTSASRRFTVRNPGTASGTYNVTVPTCTGAAIASACTPSPTPLTVPAGDSGTVTVSYSSGGSGAGVIKLLATHTLDPAVKDSGWVNLTVGTAQQPTVAVGDPSGPILARDLCLAVALGDASASECGDLRLSHPLPGIRTLGRQRTPMLEYSSAAAHPYPLVGANVSLPASASNPDSVVVRLLVSAVQKARLSWSGAGMSPGRASRVVIGYDALTDTNGVYSTNYTAITTYTVEVVSWYAGAAQPAATTTGQYVLVNRKNSPFGAGWWLSGLEQLQPASMLWTGGDGSVRQYAVVATQAMTNCVNGQGSPASNVYTASNVGHPDTIKFDGGCYWRYVPGGGKVRFDGQGRHIATINRLGDTTKFHYRTSGLAAGLLDTLTVPPPSAAARYVFVYDTTITPKRIKALIAPPIGSVPRIDSLTTSTGKLTAIQDPDTTIVNFAYDGTVANRAISRTDRRSTVTTFSYDAAAKVNGSTIDPTGLAIKTSLRAQESRGFTGTPLGAVIDTSLAYTLLDGPRTDVGDSTLFWLDRFGAPRRIRNALSEETAITRDGTWPALASRVQLPNGRVMLANYDARGHLHTVTDSGTIVNGQVAVTRYEWNMTWDAVERVVPPEQDSTVISYDGNGNRQWQQDGRGQMSRVTFGYNPTTKRLTSIRLPAAVKADSFHYDAVRGNLDTTWTPIGFRTVRFADAIGRDSLVVTPIDSQQTKTASQRVVYDLADRVKETWSFGPAMPYQLDLETSFVPDTMPVPAETLLVTNRYDLEGNLLSTTSATSTANYDLNIRDVRDYDRANRLVTKFLGSGPSSISYDPAGNAIGQGYRNGVEVTQTFDALNRLTQRVIPQVDEAQSNCYGHMHDPWTYPICGLHIPMYPNNGTGYRVAADTNTFTYDVMGNVLQANSHDAKVSRTYYPSGLVQTDTQRIRDGSTFPWVFGIRYGYDRNGRRAWTRLPLVAGDSVTYTYGLPAGFLSQIRDPQGRLFTFAYDSAGRLDTLVTYPGSGPPWGIRKTVVLDPDGRVIQRSLASNGGSGDFDVLRYDARNKVVEARTQDAAAGHTNERTTIAYDGLGAVVGSEVYNPTLLTWQSDEYRNDALGNVAWNKSTNADGAEYPHWSGYKITTGALTVRHETPPNVSCPSDAWRYDSLAQKVDAAGNVHMMDQASRHCLTSDVSLTQVVAAHNYYRADNRLMVVQRYEALTNPNTKGTWEEYRYDALGRRVYVRALRDSLCHSFSGTYDCSNYTQVTVWDGDQILAEQRGGSVVYLHGGELDHPLELIGDSRVVNYDWRGLGQSSRWTNGAPADCSVTTGSCTTIAWPAGQGVYYKHVPEPSGPIPTWVGSLVTNGEDGTTLLYRRNRYYDPASGRFTQEDPIGLAGGLNQYGFVAGDPVNFSDPFGLRPCPGPSSSFPCRLQATVDSWKASIVNLGASVLGFLGEVSGIAPGMRAGGFPNPDGSQPSTGQRVVDGVLFASALVPGDEALDLGAAAGRIESTLKDIKAGVTRFSQDGATFFNREGLLPSRAEGYYREFTVGGKPGARGAERLVLGRGGEMFFSADHYRTFVQLSK